VIAVLALIGTGIGLVRREYLLPLWLTIPFLVEGRSAILPAAIPLAMLAADGFIDGILKALSPTSSLEMEKPEKVDSHEVIAIAYVLFYLLFSSYQLGFQLSGGSVPSSDREAMSWVQKNTPADSRFLVLTGTNSISCDMVLEWFPALTARQSIYTVQGTEWTKGPDFTSYVQSTYAVQQCLRTGDISCLDSVIDRSEYNFLYIDKMPRENCRPVNLANATFYFVESLQNDKSFDLVYKSPDVDIFSR
jgi:hypothetical protein